MLIFIRWKEDGFAMSKWFKEDQKDEAQRLILHLQSKDIYPEVKRVDKPE